MHNAVKMLREFQNSLSLKLAENPAYSVVHRTGANIPYAGGSATWELCIDLIEEEYDEFRDALGDVESCMLDAGLPLGDMAGSLSDQQVRRDQKAASMMKEMCDLLYVIIGMSVRYKELTFLPEAFAAVHSNNMLKLTGGEVSPTGKLNKPPGYTKIDLIDLIIRGRTL
jgi:predicted HAD superfamily Cof-like phosphohydrolase|tara:strand:- start:135 stop:641 length:507 start_codon:yes stop_codon:yes gene_type:complete